MPKKNFESSRVNVKNRQLNMGIINALGTLAISSTQFVASIINKNKYNDDLPDTDVFNAISDAAWIQYKTKKIASKPDNSSLNNDKYWESLRTTGKALSKTDFEDQFKKITPEPTEKSIPWKYLVPILILNSSRPILNHLAIEKDEPAGYKNALLGLALGQAIYDKSKPDFTDLTKLSDKEASAGVLKDIGKVLDSIAKTLETAMSLESKSEQTILLSSSLSHIIILGLIETYFNFKLPTSVDVGIKQIQGLILQIPGTSPPEAPKPITSTSNSEEMLPVKGEDDTSKMLTLAFQSMNAQNWENILKCLFNIKDRRVKSQPSYQAVIAWCIEFKNILNNSSSGHINIKDVSSLRLELLTLIKHYNDSIANPDSSII